MAEPGTPCVIAGGIRIRGYAYIWNGGKRRRAHRVAYEAMYGQIAPGMVLDHVCHNADTECPGGESCPHRACVNPNHLEVVTIAENNRRGRVNATKDQCPAGHRYDRENTHVEQLANGKRARRCLTCRRRRDAVRRAKRREMAHA